MTNGSNLVIFPRYEGLSKDVHRIYRDEIIVRAEDLLVS